MEDFEKQFQVEYQQQMYEEVAGEDPEYKTMMGMGIEDIKKDSEANINNEYTPIIEDGPTREDIELWKRQFPKSKIFRTVILDETFIYRTINRVEFKTLSARTDLNALTREEQICRICCLWPQLTPQFIGEGDAGLIGSLAQTIMDTSGFVPPDEVERLA